MKGCSVKSGLFLRVDRLMAPVFGGPGGGAFGLAGSCVPVFQPCLGHLLRLEAKEVVLNRNEGVINMAGTSLGANAPLSSSHFSAPERAPHRVIASSRTRRNHGVFLLGNELTTVYSSRRECDGLGVSMAVGSGSLVLTGSMTSTQARAMARALIAAASAVDGNGGAA